MVPAWQEDQPNLHSLGKGHIHTFNRLPQGCKHSPSIAHDMSAKLLQQRKNQEGVELYQYTDDVLAGREEESAIRLAAQDICL